MLCAGDCGVVQHYMYTFNRWLLFLLLVQEISQTVCDIYELINSCIKYFSTAAVESRIQAGDEST